MKPQINFKEFYEDYGNDWKTNHLDLFYYTIINQTYFKNVINFFIS